MNKTCNKAQCLICGDEIESKGRHDYVECSCGNLAVDGGKDYMRRVFKTDKWVDLDEEGNPVERDAAS